VENKQYPYQVEERNHVISGYRYYTVYFQNRLVIITKNKKVADEYIELNKKHKEK